ncbi:MAG: hypothetical protein HY607_06155 [Planctomycetes bacterium]|uniref:hypothetical protein n=1 Tax=Candidatus Wunengus californicus TaxID=3367619 RepID=UPI0040299B2E|nr:hypothetical protein [Planctomycetota bacterium]
MNKKQKCVLIIVGVVIFLMLIYPPFYHEGKNMGYGFLDDPPEAVYTRFAYPENEYRYVPALVNTRLLFTQWAGVLIIGGIAWLLLRDQKKG